MAEPICWQTLKLIANRPNSNKCPNSAVVSLLMHRSFNHKFYWILFSFHARAFGSRRMIEIGYLAACQTFYHKLVANVSIYNRHRRSKEYLEMEHFIGAYFLLAAGVLIAFVAFIAEIASNRWSTGKWMATHSPKRRTTKERKTATRHSLEWVGCRCRQQLEIQKYVHALSLVGKHIPVLLLYTSSIGPAPFFTSARFALM